MYSIEGRRRYGNAAVAPARDGASPPAYSFDVFDTTLTRLWFCPTDLFLAVGRTLRREGLFAGSADEWAQARRLAEKHARSVIGVQEVTLDDIYAELRSLLDWSAGEADRAQRVELAEEKRTIRPIAETQRELAALRRRDAHCLFISDTYFETDFVAKLLQTHGIGDGIKVFASAEHGATKRSGQLYDRVFSQTGIVPQQLIHVGDNSQSDVKSAQDRGVTARLFGTQAPTRYERALYDVPGHDRLLRSAIAGSSRAVRLQQHFDDPHQRVVADTAANVAGPVLAAYVIWVLRSAHSRGIRRLYFLARDGQILVRIARKLAAWLAIDMDCRYLHASRQALFLPSIISIDDTARDWFGGGLAGLTLREVLARVNVVAGSIQDHMHRLGFDHAALDTPLTQNDRSRVVALLDDPKIRALVLDNAACARADLLCYLRQQGFADGVPAGIVDIGWKGRLQSSLARALAADDNFKTALPLTGFYYGLARRPGPEAGELLAFAPVAPTMNGPLLELFCAADHGSVRSFNAKAKGQAVPVLLEEINEEALAWGLEAQQQSIDLFAEELTRCIDTLDFNPAELEACLAAGAAAVFSLFAQRPSFAEATAFGSFLHADDQTHNNGRELAPAFGPSDLLRWLTGLGPPSAVNSFWAEGSIVRGVGPGGAAMLSLKMWQVRRGATQFMNRARS